MISREKNDICKGIFKAKIELAPLSISWSKLLSSEFLLSLVLQKPIIVITGAPNRKNQEAVPLTPTL